jgi:hypothetical protein
MTDDHACHASRSASSEGGSTITPFRRIRSASHRSGRSCSRYIISESSGR